MKDSSDNRDYIYIVKRLEDLGIAKEKLKNILDHDLFERVDKHNPYWDSQYEEESDKLESIRLEMTWIEEKLWDLYSVLNDQEQYER